MYMTKEKELIILTRLQLNPEEEITRKEYLKSPELLSPKIYPNKQVVFIIWFCVFIDLKIGDRPFT